jgi:hypothetical protein
VLATYGAAALIIVASLLVGRAFFQVLGRRETWWLETGVGLAILLVVCSVLTRVHFGAEGTGSMPERADLALIACAVLVLGSAVYLRFRFADRESFLMALPVVALTLLAVSLPFIASGHLGIPGIGVNNDMAAHLLWAEWLQTTVGRAPNGILIGYPVGPHGLVATIGQGLGTEPFYGFLGLLVAIPVITALTSLNLLHSAPPLTRTIGAVLVGVPYVAASTLGIAGFKELLIGLFLLCFVLTLRMIPRAAEGRVALIAALGVLAAGSVAVYSYPGVAWLGAAAAAWALGEVLVARSEGRLGDVRAGVRRAAPAIAVALVVMAALTVAELPRVKEFIDNGAVDTVTGTDSKLRFAVSPLEALGVWPSGEFTLGTSQLDLWWLFGAVGVIALAFGLAWWLRRGEVALPAGVAAGAIVYLLSLAQGGLYVQAKAVAVPAAVIMLLIVGSLFLSGDPEAELEAEETDDPEEKRRLRRAAEPRGIGRRAILAVPFVLLASYSSFLALRDTVVAPDDRFQELRSLRDEIEGSAVLDLTSDRYSPYYLRGAVVRSPAANAEDKFAGRQGKSQRLPVDFDSVYARDLDLFDFAVTSDADYQSGAPPNWEEAARTESYVLWKRNGPTPFVGVLAEEARPGRIFRCGRPKYQRLLDRTGVAINWPRPVIAKRLYWEVGGEADPTPAPGTVTPENPGTTTLEPGEEASQSIVLPRGTWDLSFQYSSEVVPVEVSAGDLTAEMPPGVEGAIPFRVDQGPFWPVGEVTSPGGGEPTRITIRAGELSGLQKLLGVDAPAALGNIAATRLSDIGSRAFRQSCRDYVDHYYLGAPGALQISKESGGGFAKLEPTR